MSDTTIDPARDRGTVKWKIGPKRDADGNCITRAWGRPCRLRDRKHDGMCMIELDEGHYVTIRSDVETTHGR